MLGYPSLSDEMGGYSCRQTMNAGAERGRPSKMCQRITGEIERTRLRRGAVTERMTANNKGFSEINDRRGWVRLG